MFFEECLGQRPARAMHVKLLVEIPVDDIAGRSQCNINLDGPLKSRRVVVPQPAPFVVGTIRTKHTG